MNGVRTRTYVDIGKQVPTKVLTNQRNWTEYLVRTSERNNQSDWSTQIVRWQEGLVGLLYCEHRKRTNFEGSISGVSTVAMKLKLAHDWSWEFNIVHEDSDQPGHPPSLIRVVAVRSIDN